MNATLTPNRWDAVLESVRMFSELFWGPKPESCQQILAGGFIAHLETLRPVLRCDPPDALDRLRKGIQGFGDAEALYQRLEEDYVRLFVNDRGGIAAPLYASCYEGDHPRLMGAAAAEMRERLASKGLALDENISHPPDHLSIELEYLYFLLDRAAGGSNADAVAEAATFSSDAMLPWVKAWACNLATDSGQGFYPTVASLLLAMLHLIAALGPEASTG